MKWLILLGITITLFSGGERKGWYYNVKSYEWCTHGIKFVDNRGKKIEYMGEILVEIKEEK